MTDNITPNKWVKTISGVYGRVADTTAQMARIRVVRVLRSYRTSVEFTGEVMVVPIAGCKMICKPGHILE